jgi:riboflavin synthase
MFTGIIECTGLVENLTHAENAKRITISALPLMDDLKPDDSVSVDGVCLTVETRDERSFQVTAVQETLLRSTLSGLKRGDSVNLERALRTDSRLGGHLVSGHVDCTARIVSLKKEGKSRIYRFEIPREYDRYLVEKGSVSIDGISLTVASLKPGFFTVSVIPYSLEKTTLSQKNSGSRVNVEFDILGKYVEKMLSRRNDFPPLTGERLLELGY